MKTMNKKLLKRCIGKKCGNTVFDLIEKNKVRCISCSDIYRLSDIDQNHITIIIPTLLNPEKHLKKSQSKKYQPSVTHTGKYKKQRNTIREHSSISETSRSQQNSYDHFDNNIISSGFHDSGSSSYDGGSSFGGGESGGGGSGGDY